MIYIKWYLKCCKWKSCGYFFSTLAIQVASTSSTSKLCGAAGLGFAHIGRVKAWWWIIAWRRPGTHQDLPHTLISPLVHPNIFFHKFPEDVLPHRFCNFHVCAVFHKMAKVFCGTSRDFQQKIALFTQQTQGCSLKWQSSQSSQAGWNPRSTCCHIIWILQLSISRASATSEVAIPSFTPGEASDAYQNRDHSAAIILEVAPGGTNRSEHGMAPGSLIAESVWVSASCCWWTYSLLSWFSRNSAIYSNIL